MKFDKKGNHLTLDFTGDYVKSNVVNRLSVANILEKIASDLKNGRITMIDNGNIIDDFGNNLGKATIK